MKRKSTRWLVSRVAVATALQFAWTARGSATSYPPLMQPAEALEHADTIFEGTVRDCDSPLLLRTWFRLLQEFPWHASPPPPEEIAKTMTRVTFALDHVWKGQVGPSIDIAAPPGGGGDCGTEFKKGARYLVYASAFGGLLATDRSYRTTAIEHAQGDLEFLANQTRAARLP